MKWHAILGILAVFLDGTLSIRNGPPFQTITFLDKGQVTNYNLNNGFGVDNPLQSVLSVIGGKSDVEVEVVSAQDTKTPSNNLQNSQYEVVGIYEVKQNSQPGYNSQNYQNKPRDNDYRRRPPPPPPPPEDDDYPPPPPPPPPPDDDDYPPPPPPHHHPPGRRRYGHHRPPPPPPPPEDDDDDYGHPPPPPRDHRRPREPPGYGNYGHPHGGPPGHNRHPPPPPPDDEYDEPPPYHRRPPSHRPPPPPPPDDEYGEPPPHHHRPPPHRPPPPPPPDDEYDEPPPHHHRPPPHRPPPQYGKPSNRPPPAWIFEEQFHGDKGHGNRPDFNQQPNYNNPGQQNIDLGIQEQRPTFTNPSNKPNKPAEGVVGFVDGNFPVILLNENEIRR